MGNYPKSQEIHAFVPIKIKDMYNDCNTADPLPVKYEEFLHIVNTMDKAKYTIISHDQIEQLKQKIGEIITIDVV